MNLSWGQCECARPKRMSATALVKRYRESTVEPGAAVEDVKINRRQIVRDMVKMRRHLMIEGQRAMAKFLRSMFETQVNRVCDRMEEILRGAGRKNTTEVSLGDAALEAMWATILEDVLGGNATVQVINGYTPIVQSVAARAHTRTAMFLGESPPRPVAPPTPSAPGAPPPAAPPPTSTPPGEIDAAIHRRSQRLAQEVTRINETTRNRLVDALKDSLAKGETVAEAVQTIRASVPEIAASRIPTIARTEVGKAVDEGTKEAVKRSPSVTFVSVIGCTGVEPNIPTFDGRPTCNITDVPANRVDELRFHPNHTGCIVATGFVTDKR